MAISGNRESGPLFSSYIILWLKILLSVKFIFLCAGAIAPFDLPEIWRQTDTMGVSYRYSSSPLSMAITPSAIAIILWEWRRWSH